MPKTHGDPEGHRADPSFSADLRSVTVRPILPEEEEAWDRTMSSHHYLGFRCLVGESLKYVAILNGEWVALLGWGCAAFKIAPRDRWIGWAGEQQFRRLHLIANNQRFLILPGVRIKNLASRVLSVNVRRLSEDWQALYGHPVLLAETFVDPERFGGVSYRAAGWQVLGSSRGFRRNAGRYYHHGKSKMVLVRELRPDARALLSAPFLAGEFLKGEKPMLDLNCAVMEGKGGLLEALAQLSDPRKRRGIRHKYLSLLAVAVCAVLSGARSFMAIAQWGSELSQDLLKRLGCRWGERSRKFVAPSEPTLRRTLQAVDAEALDRVVGGWLCKESQKGAVAVDGKTVRGSRSAEGKPVHLLSAFLHKEGAVVAQQAVLEKSNEITAFQPLLSPLELEGRVVTGDAMHAQGEHARYLVKEKKADYVFAVKENQPTLLRSIQDLDEGDFFPCAP